MIFQKIILPIKTILITIISLLAISGYSQTKAITISGTVKDSITNTPVPYANVIIKSSDSALKGGTVTNENGYFIIDNIHPGNYTLEVSSVGYTTQTSNLFVGSLSEFINIGEVKLAEDAQLLNEVVIDAKTADEINNKMDKKTFALSDNIAQIGGSALQAMQNLPGVTTQDGKLQLRGNDKVTVLIDGRQTALTGFNGQSGLDNIPALAIEKIEIINNPSSKYDANGNAGIINIIYKKIRKRGLTAKLGWRRVTGRCGNAGQTFQPSGRNTN